MEGIVYKGLCPCCDHVMDCRVCHRPYEWVEGICLFCGFIYCTEEKRLSIKEVNKRRKECGIKELKKLKSKYSK